MSGVGARWMDRGLGQMTSCGLPNHWAPRCFPKAPPETTVMGTQGVRWSTDQLPRSPLLVFLCVHVSQPLCGRTHFGDALDFLELVRTTEDTTEKQKQTNGSTLENVCRVNSEAGERLQRAMQRALKKNVPERGNRHINSPAHFSCSPAEDWNGDAELPSRENSKTVLHPLPSLCARQPHP